MAQKTVELPGIGAVTLSKRRGSKNLRLSVQPDGQIRVGMPTWLPYAAGIKFALSRTDWINQHRQYHKPLKLRDGGLIGKTYKLRIVRDGSVKRTASRIIGKTILVTSPHGTDNPAVQATAAKVCERALKQEAEELLGPRLQLLSNKTRLSYESLRIRRLRSRWGSCSSEGVITLSYYLVQLPWGLIDYVLLHELAHTKQPNHGPKFWALFESILPNARSLRHETRHYRPVLAPN